MNLFICELALTSLDRLWAYKTLRTESALLLYTSFLYCGPVSGQIFCLVLSLYMFVISSCLRDV